MNNKIDINYYDNEIYYTYHSKKNKKALPKIILFSILFIFTNGALVYEFIIWGFYFYWCWNNNNILNNDKDNLKRRQMLIQLKQKELNKQL